jgi:hypothetical protein
MPRLDRSLEFSKHQRNLNVSSIETRNIFASKLGHDHAVVHAIFVLNKGQPARDGCFSCLKGRSRGAFCVSSFILRAWTLKHHFTPVSTLNHHSLSFNVFLGLLAVTCMSLDLFLNHLLPQDIRVNLDCWPIDVVNHGDETQEASVNRHDLFGRRAAACEENSCLQIPSSV